METLRLLFDQIDEAVLLLKKGEPVAVPTETVYGLAAPIFSTEGVNKIFSLKGRPQDNPLIAHVSSLEMVEQIAESIPPIFWTLAQKYWPGPITFVLPKKSTVPLSVSGGLETVAIRMPSHPVALALIEKLGEPLVAPSANLSGKPSPTQVEHVLEDFDGKIVAVIDGGPSEFGLESTILSLAPVPTLLRPGAISKEELEQFLGLSIGDPLFSHRPLAPGMKYRHYAPKGTVRIVKKAEEVKGSFVLSKDPVAPYPHRPLNGPSLYRHLREADALGVDEIFVLLDSCFRYDEALLNRLFKAAEPYERSSY